jgi:hypothetical protein
MINSTSKMVLLGVRSGVFWALAIAVMAVTTGCQSAGGGVIPAAEYALFTPKPKEQRVIQEVKLRWEVREDVAQYCAKTMGMGQEQAYLTPPVACAVWHVAKKECVVITGKETSHVALGHEVRHCFEGHFHK